MAMKPKAKRKPEAQPDLEGMTGPGVEQPRIDEIDALAGDYYKEKEKRCKISPREIAAKGKLIEALHKHTEAGALPKNDKGEIRYRFGDIMVVLRPGKEKLEVKAVEAFEEDDL